MAKEGAAAGGAYTRRNMLRGAAGVTVAAGAAVLTSPEETQAYAPPGDEARGRYRESDHVKAFYRTNAYETKNKR